MGGAWARAGANQQQQQVVRLVLCGCRQQHWQEPQSWQQQQHMQSWQHPLLTLLPLLVVVVVRLGVTQ
jgi:hypothetical protein